MQTSGRHGRPPGGPYARTVSGMMVPNPLGSARPAVGPYRKGLSGEEPKTEGATGQKATPRNPGVSSFANDSAAPPPPRPPSLCAPSPDNGKKGNGLTATSGHAAKARGSGCCGPGDYSLCGAGSRARASRMAATSGEFAWSSLWMPSSSFRMAGSETSEHNATMSSTFSA